MTSLNDGWGLDAGRVLRTTDGGHNWKNATPLQFSESTGSHITAVAFQSASEAWIAASIDYTHSPVEVFHTTNGGQRWTVASLNDAKGIALTISFADVDHGWLLVLEGVAASAEAIGIWHSDDGGVHWAKLVTVGDFSGSPTHDGGLPFWGEKTGLVFRDFMTGWITLYNNEVVGRPTEPVLFVTRDGGKDWQAQTLIIPQSFGSVRFMKADPPQFAADGSGLLSVQYGLGSSVALLFYASHDDGQTWLPLTPVMFRSSPTTYGFVDRLHGWASDGTGLYRTNNGGQGWTQLVLRQSMGPFAQMDFLSPSIGWAIVPTVNGPESGLLLTRDGGESWNPIGSRSPP